jgi:hypothetical protein
MKRCCRCKTEKSLKDFHINNASKDKHRAACKNCALEENKKSYYKNSTAESRKKSKLKYRYDLTPEDYAKKVEEQQGKCAICGKIPEKRPLYIDHDHITDKLRDLICLKCNVIIGQANDNIDLLESAIAYLKRHQ